MRLSAHSEPTYPVRHSGPVIVAGSAWCLHDDLARCRAIYGDIPVIAINGASREVKAFALFSIHTDRFVKPGHEWIYQQERRFGRGEEAANAVRAYWTPEAFISEKPVAPTERPIVSFEVHGTPKRKDHPQVDYWWHGARKGGGSSSWCARRVAGWMGFEPVVLCGAPLDPGNYASDRPGEMMTKIEVIDRYRRQVETDTEWHQGALSMSGWTASILGSPSPASASPVLEAIPPSM